MTKIRNYIYNNAYIQYIYIEKRCHYWQRLSIKSVVIIQVYTPWSLKVIGSVYHTFTD